MSDQERIQRSIQWFELAQADLEAARIEQAVGFSARDRLKIVDSLLTTYGLRKQVSG
jgi:hypothetical protein